MILGKIFVSSFLNTEKALQYALQCCDCLVLTWAHLGDSALWTAPCGADSFGVYNIP